MIITVLSIADIAMLQTVRLIIEPVTKMATKLLMPGSIYNVKPQDFYPRQEGVE